MRLLEYEAKKILRDNSIPVPVGIIIETDTAYNTLTTPLVLKSQVPTGGRGKLGGVRVIEDSVLLPSVLSDIFARDIKGFKPRSILAEEKIAIAREHYLSLLIDRDNAEIRLIAHSQGGIEVEENDTDDFLKTPINRENIGDCAIKLAKLFEYPQEIIKDLIGKLYEVFISNDATLIEINPLIVTQDNLLTCGDCKMELDDAATFRHPEWDFEDAPDDINFVILNPKGNTATIANGAGLAMATVDAVASAGMQPANFLDIGGGATAESVFDAFRKINEFPHIKAIVINIFAGITRCDEVARAIIEAKKQIPTLPPLYIRLTGTHFKEAMTLLETADINTLSTLEECLAKAKRVVDA